MAAGWSPELQALGPGTPNAAKSRKAGCCRTWAAGLAAALSAAEQARSRGVLVDITVLERAREDEAGGNTRWSPSKYAARRARSDRPGFRRRHARGLRRAR